MDPTDINNKGVQAVFAIIGCSFVLAIVWFFFIAKNGGFVFRKGDWEEYKSTVLRRKGPDGKTLSNATKSTRLGGGSVVGSGYSDQDTETGYGDDTSTVYTGTMSELSSSTAPIIQAKNGRAARSEKSANQTRMHRDHQRRGETNKERKQREMAQADFEGGHDRDVRAYMREKPARVGGLNSQGDTLHYGTDYTDSEPGMSQTGTHTHAHRQQERRRTSRSPEKRDPNHTRRDFSYNTNPQQEQDQFTVPCSARSPSPPPLRVPAPSNPSPSRYHPTSTPARPAPVARESPATHTYTIGAEKRFSSIPGSFPQYTQPLEFNGHANTRSYHHPLPGLGRNAGAGGFRRGMGGGLDE